MLRDYKFGIIIGLIFGLLIIPLSVFGLASNVAGLFGLIFNFLGRVIGQLFLIQTGPNSQSASIAMPVAFSLNGIFYALIGGLLQKWLKKKKYVVFVFLGIITAMIIGMIIEYFVRGGLTA